MSSRSKITISFLVFALCSVMQMRAQKQGRIIYDMLYYDELDSSLYFELKDDPAIPPEVRKRLILGGWSAKKEVLFFNDSCSLFRAYIKGEDEDYDNRYEAPKGYCTIGTCYPSSRSHVNYNQSKLTQVATVYGKDFLLNESWKKPTWEITKEMEEIMGYPCYMAKYKENDTSIVKAWFAPQIPSAVGPVRYGGLPGAILKLKVGRYTYVARSIDLKPFPTGETRKPDFGKKITRKELEEIKIKKKKEREELSKNKGEGFIVVPDGPH